MRSVAVAAPNYAVEQTAGSHSRGCSPRTLGAPRYS